MEIRNLSSEYAVRHLGNEDVGIIFELSRHNHIFYQYHPPFVTTESILEDIGALPPDKDYTDKFYIGFFDGGTLIAVMDLILDYPQEKTAFIGLFMMDAAFQGRGTGSKIIGECAAYLTSLGYQKIRLGIDKGNPQSDAFWRKNGFIKTGEEVPNDFSAYLLMERIL